MLGVRIIEGKPCTTGAQLLTIHGKKAQISVCGKTQHVVEIRCESDLTYFRNAIGEEYGFTSQEIRHAIFRS